MVGGEPIVGDVGAEIYIRKHAGRRTVDDDCMGCHDLRSQFLIGQHTVCLVCARYKYAFNAQLLRTNLSRDPYQSG